MQYDFLDWKFPPNFTIFRKLIQFGVHRLKKRMGGNPSGPTDTNRIEISKCVTDGRTDLMIYWPGFEGTIPHADIQDHIFIFFHICWFSMSQLLRDFSFKPELGARVGGPRCLRDISTFQIKLNFFCLLFQSTINAEWCSAMMSVAENIRDSSLWPDCSVLCVHGRYSLMTCIWRH